MLPGTPTEWRPLETAIEAKRTQGSSDITREEKIKPGTQPKPKRATMPPETPMEATGATKAAEASDVVKTTKGETTESNLFLAKKQREKEA